jgi:hypothetical protein
LPRRMALEVQAAVRNAGHPHYFEIIKGLISNSSFLWTNTIASPANPTSTAALRPLDCD